MKDKLRTIRNEAVKLLLNEDMFSQVYRRQVNSHCWKTDVDFVVGGKLVKMSLSPKLTQILACHLVGATRRYIEEGVLDEKDHLDLTTRSEP